MNINDQLKKKIDGIYPLIAEVDFNVSTLEHIYTVLSAEELIMFDKYHLLQTLRHSLWNFSILDLCKLFLESEKFSLHRLINILINNHKQVSFIKTITIRELKGITDQIWPYKDKIDKLKYLRDIRIAHRDDKSGPNNILLRDLRELVKLSQLIFNSIYDSLYDSKFIWRFKEDTKELSMIRYLAKYDSIYKIVSVAEVTKSLQISTKVLSKIIRN
jgi:serine/threonine protein kinase